MECSAVRMLSTQEPEVLAGAIHRASLTSLQLSGTPSRSWLARVACPTVCLNFAHLGPAMLFSGVMSEDCFTLVFVTACPGVGHSFNFGIRHTDGYLGFFPPGATVDAFTPSGYANATLTIPAVQFRAAIARGFSSMPESVMSRGAAMRVGAGEQVALRQLLGEVENTVRTASELLEGVDPRRILEGALLDAFLAALGSASGEGLPSGGRSPRGRHQKLRLARDYIATHYASPVHLGDLCGELGLSQRGVEYLFRDLLGIRPTAYLRHVRLHSARGALRRGKPAHGAVKRIALGCGFWHLGHFAHDYRALFGEAPAKTLARR